MIAEEDRFIEYDDEEIDLRDMLANMMHHVTKDTLTVNPVVLFKEEGFVDALRVWVGAGGDFEAMEAAGGRSEWLRDMFNAHVRGRPFHSQSAERASVQTSVQNDSRGGELVTSIKTSLTHQFREMQRLAGEFSNQQGTKDAEEKEVAAGAAIGDAADECVRNAATLAGLTERDLEGFVDAAGVDAPTAPAAAPKGPKKWNDKSQGRVRAVVRPLAQVHNSRSLWYHLVAARKRWAQLKDPAFMLKVWAEENRCTALGLSRPQEIEKQKQIKLAKREAGAQQRQANPKIKKFTAVDAAEQGKAATPAVPMTASGRLNFTGWAPGAGVGKKPVGMEVTKNNVANEMVAWGHVFHHAEMASGGGEYTG